MSRWRAQAFCSQRQRYVRWTDGPTKGTTQEHVFYKNGTVEWHSIEEDGKAKAATGSGDEGHRRHLRGLVPRAVGYTLTVVLNFLDNATVAIASNQKHWLPAHGTCEVMS